MAQKPHLTLAKAGKEGLTFDQVLQLHEKLSGRKATPAEIEELKAQQAKRAKA